MNGMIKTFVLAVVFVLSACEVIEPDTNNGIAGEVPVKDSVVFSASFEAQTKTNINYNPWTGVYDILWSPSDYIVVWDAESITTDYPVYESCALISGADTPNAKFIGSLEAKKYIALYGDGPSYPYGGKPCMYFPALQMLTPGGISDSMLPMVAVSDSKDFEFKATASLLKLSLTGNGEILRSIQVFSKDEKPMSGWGFLELDDASEPLFKFMDPDEAVVNSSIYCYLDDTRLSSIPNEYYIVVPAQTYEGGLCIEFQTRDGERMVVSTAPNVETKRAQVHEIPTIDFGLKYGSVYGEYLAKGYNYHYDSEVTSWSATFVKDESNNDIVWIKGITPNAFFDVWGYLSYDSEGQESIMIPVGQAWQEEGWYLALIRFDYSESALLTDGYITLNRQKDGSFVADYGISLYAFDDGNGNSGIYELYNPGIIYTKQ